MIPMWQLMMGICAGLVVLVLTRPQANNNHHEERERHRRAQTHRPAQTPTKVEEPPKSIPGDNCVICMGEMNRHTMKYLPCRHAVHTDCFKSVEQHKGICPICRESV